MLRRDCPASGWRLCEFIGRFPPTSDEFLWRPDGPVIRAGGGEVVSSEDEMQSSARRCAPNRVPWRAQSWSTRCPSLPFSPQAMACRRGPARSRYGSNGTSLPSRPQLMQRHDRLGALGVPDWLRIIHSAAALSGCAICCSWRRRAVTPRAAWPRRSCWRCWPTRQSPADFRAPMIATRPHHVAATADRDRRRHLPAIHPGFAPGR